MLRWLRSLFSERFPSEREGTWTFAVLPDTQIYTKAYPELFEAQTRWIAENAERHRILFALHEGDIVNDNADAQWEVAARALGRLEEGRVPFVCALGNHDYGPLGSCSDRTTLFDRYVDVRAIATRPSFGGSFEPGRVDNSFHLFETPSGPWLVLALEFGPRDEVVAWAGEVLSKHRATPAIVLTHAYTYYDDTRYDRARDDQKWSPHVYGVAKQPGGVNDGEALYRKLVHEHPCVQLVLSGHVLGRGTARITSPQRDGSVVHQLLANYQHHSRGGDGYFRLMEIDGRRERIRVRTFSPVHGRYRDDPQDAFDLPLPRFGGS